MRKHAPLLILSMIGLLAGCTPISGGVDFPFTKIETLPTFYRNGDLYGLEDLETPYEITVKEISKDGIANSFERNEPVFLFAYQSTCSHCVKIHTRFNQFLFDSMIDCYAFNESDLIRNIDWLYANYPDTREVVQKLTPAAYFLLPDGTAFDLHLVEHIDLASSFENHIKPLMNLCCVYTFSEAERLLSFLEKTKSLVYFYEDKEGDDAFQESVINQFDAKKINKAIAKVDISKMSAEDKAVLIDKFGENIANHVFYSEKGKEIGDGQSLEEASLEDGLLTKYYSKVIMN